MSTSRRYLYGGIGLLLIAVALGGPAFARGYGPRPGFGFGPGSRFGPGLAGLPVAGPVRGGATLETAGPRTREVLLEAGYADLVPTRVIEFRDHFMVLVTERSTERGALQLVVQRNGAVHPEPGPTLLWNTRYGAAIGPGGPAGRGGARIRGQDGVQRAPGGPGAERRGSGPPGAGPRSAEQRQALQEQQARALAQEWLDAARPGATAEDGLAFYGYFTFGVMRDRKTTGLVSVNAFTGQVWGHEWHGEAVAELRL